MRNLVSFVLALPLTLPLACAGDDSEGTTTAAATSATSTTATTSAASTATSTSDTTTSTSTGDPELPFDPEDPNLQVCGFGDGSISIESATIGGDLLTLVFWMTDGCGDEWTALCWDEALVDGPPVSAALGVGYAFTNPQGCETGGSVQVMREFSLAPLKAAYINKYGGPGGEIQINLAAYPDPLVYTF